MTGTSFIRITPGVKLRGRGDGRVPPAAGWGNLIVTFSQDSHNVAFFQPIFRETANNANFHGFIRVIRRLALFSLRILMAIRLANLLSGFLALGIHRAFLPKLRDNKSARILSIVSFSSDKEDDPWLN